MTGRFAMPLLAAAAAAVFITAAAPADPVAMIKVREKGMKDIGAAFKKLKGEVDSGKPDPAVVKANAATVNRLAGVHTTWFPRGSGPEAGHKTHTKAVAWTDTAGFKSAQQKFITEAAKLNAVGLAGDMKAFPAQFRATGGACKGCHDKFREED